MTGPVLIAAGGTGGHLFPAEALAHALAARGVVVHLVTDHRATTYGKDFPAAGIHIVSSATIDRGSPIRLVRSGLALARGMVQSFALIGRLKPAVAIGFGGYPTIPPLFAAVSRGVPSVVHEANAVAGRANRYLAGKVTAVATSFETTGLLGAASAKAVWTGNPVRPIVVAAAGPYAPPEADGPFHLLVFGGSQGARVFADLVPPVLERLAPDLRARLRLVQQARPEDVERVSTACRAAAVEAVVAPFFADLPERIATAHLVVCRSGASSVTELSVIGRPSILVPLPHALDNDQKTNAVELQKAGGAVMAEQADLSPERLAGLLTELMNDPGRLAGMATAARSFARPDAVDRLADLVLDVAQGRGVPTPRKRT
ncbi:MAG TPA: undecaprenyldiphospho-muramoylpentapeptide beta-N-acetylglucosaminyltransferase [Methylomirabilota bacterium]|nr:undecaprenyldiphospho-muramoylpentapeptide beta-N-acetylglucosaminyltransferase [Methylomirabilota bacterium]